MNLTPRLIEFLSQEPSADELILVPGARPMVRREGGLVAMDDAILSAADVRETLVSLHSRSPRGTQELQDQEGLFCFGMPGRGRFRVTFMTQRGSYALTMAEVPTKVLTLADLLGSDTAARCYGEFRDLHRGLLVVASLQETLANTLAYSLLRTLNENESRVIVTIEPFVTYVLPHDHSIVVQSEVALDSATLASALRAALHLDPHVIYLRGFTRPEDLAPIMHAARADVLVLLALSNPDLEVFFSGGRVPLAEDLFHGFWRVDRDQGGAFHLSATN